MAMKARMIEVNFICGFYNLFTSSVYNVSFVTKFVYNYKNRNYSILFIPGGITNIRKMKLAALLVGALALVSATETSSEIEIERQHGPPKKGGKHGGFHKKFYKMRKCFGTCDRYLYHCIRHAPKGICHREHNWCSQWCLNRYMPK